MLLVVKLGSKLLDLGGTGYTGLAKGISQILFA